MNVRELIATLIDHDMNATVSISATMPDGQTANGELDDVSGRYRGQVDLVVTIAEP